MSLNQGEKAIAVSTKEFKISQNTAELDQVDAEKQKSIEWWLPVAECRDGACVYFRRTGQ